jgi:Protein of unknown function (DUF4038)/Putative collagen-binding domain of a collagenase
MLRQRLLCVICVSAVVAIGTSSAAARTDSARRAADPTTMQFRTQAVTGSLLFPLKASRNRRYIVDQRGRPFFIVGDSPQAMIGNLPVSDAAAFIANRKAVGFNSLLVDLLCAKYTACRDDGTTIDGIKPFTTPGDLATPDPKYFARADEIIRLAGRSGMAVFLDPIETGGWLGVLRTNGVKKSYAFGQYLGRRYKRFANIVWWHGNDFQTWRNARDDAVVLAVARGIQSVDPKHLQTILLDFPHSGSLDDPRWQPLIQLDSVYTYLPTYAEMLKEYNRTDHLPVFMGEAGYEFEKNSEEISPGNPDILRRQAYWSVLSGACGQFYGNHYTWQFADDWKKHLNTPGSAQVGYLAKLFAGKPWWRLVPDQTHTLVTSGYGTFSSDGNVGSSNYVTTAATPDGTLAISYLPAGGKIAVDMSRFAGLVVAQWYDPAKGTYSAVRGSPFPNAQEVQISTPGSNADGDPDWVLVLRAR